MNCCALSLSLSFHKFLTCECRRGMADPMKEEEEEEEDNPYLLILAVLMERLLRDCWRLAIARSLGSQDFLSSLILPQHQNTTAVHKRHDDMWWSTCMHKSLGDSCVCACVRGGSMVIERIGVLAFFKTNLGVVVVVVGSLLMTEHTMAHSVWK